MCATSSGNGWMAQPENRSIPATAAKVRTCMVPAPHLKPYNLRFISHCDPLVCAIPATVADEILLILVSESWVRVCSDVPHGGHSVAGSATDDGFALVNATSGW